MTPILKLPQMFQKISLLKNWRGKGSNNDKLQVGGRLGGCKVWEGLQKVCD